MLTVKSLSPSFQLQPKVSSNKLAQQKADKLFEVSKEIAQKTVEKIEVLPYHTMGTVKYKNMGLKYPLENTLAPTKEEVRHAKIMLGVIKNVD